MTLAKLLLKRSGGEDKLEWCEKLMGREGMEMPGETTLLSLVKERRRGTEASSCREK